MTTTDNTGSLTDAEVRKLWHVLRYSDSVLTWTKQVLALMTSYVQNVERQNRELAELLERHDRQEASTDNQIEVTP